MKIWKFFEKHSKIRQLLCKHEPVTDIGTLKCWNGNEFLISQCEVCGLLFADGKPYRLFGSIIYDNSQKDTFSHVPFI